MFNFLSRLIYIMNEYIYKSFSDKFESYKQREELVNNIRYFNDIDYAKMDPTNIGQHSELSYVKNIYELAPSMVSRMLQVER
jgi:hypothetical protein